MPFFAQTIDSTIVRIVSASAAPGPEWKEVTETNRIGQILDGDSFVDPPSYPSHAEALAVAASQVRTTSDAVLAAATENASPVEMATWPGKLRAARAFGTAEETPEDQAQLDAVGAPRGLDRAGAAALIITKANLFQAAANLLEAKRVAALAALEAVDLSGDLRAYITTVEGIVAAIDWTLPAPT